MKWTESLIPTLREDPQDAEIISHKLLVRGAFIRKLTAGAYAYLPLGLKVLTKAQNIIRDEMNKAGAQEVLLPALQPIELWEKTGRHETLQDVMIKFRDRHGKIVCLGPTHEEVITWLAAGNITSYKQLPQILYQIQTKFRDEIRPRFGIMRSCEFIMKDAYSFDTDWDALDKSYKKMYDAYFRILKRCGLPFYAVQADPGVMGNGESHEFMVPALSGEDQVGICECGYAASKEFMTKGLDVGAYCNTPLQDIKCPECSKTLEIKNTIEVGHTFKLGLKYSTPLEAKFLGSDKIEHDMIMGCYGIGVNRILCSAIETSNDENGIIWPVSIAPYEVVVVPLNVNQEDAMNLSLEIYNKLKSLGVDVLLDDRDERPGVKFKDADLIGFPYKVIIGGKGLQESIVEIKSRKTGKIEKVPINKAVETVKDILS
ncbi:MAG: proline--tRNA ligase [Candidatus Omnitrophica bacterium]|nr:proline--tRNA ligase [Candidatus Omnitrophota bacterium]